MYSEIINELNEQKVQLVAVSKTKPILAIQEIYSKGQRVFGENRAQEMAEKYKALPKDIQWHFIGHLQRNKIKYIAPFVELIHSIDEIKLLDEVQKQAAANDRIIQCLIQIKIGEESTKTGLNKDNYQDFFQHFENNNYPNIQLIGIMGMASFTSDKKQIRTEFKSLKMLFDQIQSQFFPKDDQFKEISMGMSGDYTIAIEEGSTMVRIGSLIFGARNYG